MRISDWSSDVCSSDLRSTRLLNDSVRDFLGGNVLVAADTSYDTDGIIRIQRLNVSAPAFRLTGGSGRYSPDGGISFAAKCLFSGLRALGCEGQRIAGIACGLSDRAAPGRRDRTGEPEGAITRKP